jgi:hypothetical protein
VAEHAHFPRRTSYADARERYGLYARIATGGMGAHGRAGSGPSHANDTSGGHDNSGQGRGSGRATDPDHGKQEEGHQ